MRTNMCRPILLTDLRSDDGLCFFGSAHLRRPAQLLAASVTGSAVNGVSQLVLGDKLVGLGLSYDRVDWTTQHPHFSDATL